MKLPRGFLLAVGTVPFAHLTYSQATGAARGRPSAIRDVLTRLAEDDIANGGIAEVHPIPPADEQVADALVGELEADDQATVVGEVVLGELLCDSLVDAPGSTLLRFPINSNQTVIAERSSYSSIDGSVFADGNERKIWMGNVVEPEPALPSTASVSWTDPCDVESFLLKIVSPNADGTTTVFKSVPCSAGTSTELCMVEVSMVFFAEEEELPQEQPSLEPVPVDEEGVRRLTEHSTAAKNTEESLRARGLRGLGGDATAMPSGRGLQAGTQVDVMVLYTQEAWSQRSMTEAQLETNIASAFQTSDEAMVNSAVDLEFNLVYVGQLPYNQMVYDANVGLSPELNALQANEDVLDLRNLHRADLVMLIGYFPGTCGVGYGFNGDQIYGFSCTDSTCFDNLSHTHEMGHNFGCNHNRENSTRTDDFRYGFRHCDGADPYRTIMAYHTPTDAEVPCNVPRVNYFSNPDVIFQNKATGDADNDNARCIEASMEDVSHFRDPCLDDGATCSSDYECCNDFCLDGVCVFDTCGEAGGSYFDVGDSVCDPANNNVECNWDDGDCCECDCEDPVEIEWSCEASAIQDTQRLKVFGDASQCPALVPYEEALECGYFGGGTCDCRCLVTTIDGVCGSGDGYDCDDPDSTCSTTTPCTSDADCTLPEQCCPVQKICEEPVTTNPLACGDPHMTGFRGQRFDFTGDDGKWYCLISHLPSMHMNMRVTAPIPSLPEITYITGLSVVTTDAEGLDHSIVIEVTNPHSLESACRDGVSPCLADGALSVIIDGSEQLLQPGAIAVAQDVAVSAVNLPGECRSFGFEKYWERKKLEYAQASRRLSEEQGMGEWILGDPTATNMEECVEYVAKATSSGEEGLFEHQSEHASFQIVTPTATVRLSHGRLHQLPMRDPTDRFDLPDHLTWQMNVGLERNGVNTDATGVLGETLVPTVGEDGHEIMTGMESIRGSQEDYRVAGPLGLHFAQGASA